jgi:hypothetical protein
MSKVVAIVEYSVGNAEVGDMRIETEIFDADTPVREIVLWASEFGQYTDSSFNTSKHGRLIITVPTSERGKEGE